MSEKWTITEVSDSVSGGSYKVQCKWGETEALIILLNSTEVHECNYVLEDSSRYIQSLELKPLDYFVEIKKALSQFNPDLKYIFSEGALTLQRVVGEGLSMTLNIFKFVQVPPLGLMGLLRNQMDTTEILLKQIQELNEKHKALEDNYQLLNQAFDGCVKEKNDMETALLEKFLVLLNEKKRQLRRLQERSLMASTANQSDDLSDEFPE